MTVTSLQCVSAPFQWLNKCTLSCNAASAKPNTSHCTQHVALYKPECMITHSQAQFWDEGRRPRACGAAFRVLHCYVDIGIPVSPNSCSQHSQAGAETCVPSPRPQVQDFKIHSVSGALYPPT